LTNLVKHRVTKNFILQGIKSLSIKHSEELIVYLTLNEIRLKEQYIESHATNKILRSLKYELFEVDLEFKNQLIMNHNLKMLILDENTIKDDLQVIKTIH